MTTTLLPPIPPAPTIPLTAAALEAYQNLYDKYEEAIESTNDPGLLAVLNASQNDVDNVLTKDSIYRVQANTVLFGELLKQINSTNEELKVLKGQIAKVASDVAMAGQIIAAIDKVLGLFGGL